MDLIDQQYEKSIRKVGEYANKLEDLKDKFKALKESAVQDLRSIDNELTAISDQKKSDQEEFF